MIHNYFKIIIRNLTKNRFYTLSIITGMVIAFSVCWVLLSQMVFEFEADKFHSNYRSIYRVTMTDPITLDESYVTFHELRDKLNQYPEVDNITTLVYKGPLIVNIGNSEIFSEKKILYADSMFLEVFDFGVIYGSRSRSLSNNNSAVISTSTSLKYFGNKNSIGKQIIVNGIGFEVTAIVHDGAQNSHIKFDILLAAGALPKPTGPLSQGGFTYLTLHKGSEYTDLMTKLNVDSDNLLSWKQEGRKVNLQQLTDCYFSNVQPFHQDVLSSKDKRVFIQFGIICFSVLFLAVINLIIFFQAKALFNSRILSLQYLFGGSRKSSQIHFILEAYILVSISLLGSFCTLIALGPFMDRIGVNEIHVNLLLNPYVVSILLCLAIFLGLLLGLVTNLFYRQTRNNSSLNQAFTVSNRSNKVLNAIVVFQISVSVVIGLFGAIVWNQIDFVRRIPLGFSRDGIIEINLLNISKSSDPNSIKNLFLQNSEALSASICMGIPLSGRGYRSFEFDEEPVEFSWLVGDSDFTEVIGLQLLLGRPFLSFSDTSNILINETAGRLYEFDTNLHSNHPNAPTNVIGIVKDFYFKSLHQKITPVFITYLIPKTLDVWGSSKILVKSNNVEALIPKLMKQWKDSYPETPFEYLLLDQVYQDVYSEDENQGKLILLGTIVSIIITIVGMAGVSYYSTYKRSKEIAIRKVYGASSSKLIIQSLSNFVVKVLLASAIALPLAVYFGNSWLQNFVYKPAFPVGMSITVIVIMILLSVSSVLYQTLRSALANPIESLKME